MNPLVRRALGAACAVTVTLGLTAGLAPSVYAGKLVREDARRDVVRWDIVDESETVVPHRKDPDLRRVTIDYRQGALIIRMKYAALPRLVGRSELLFVLTRDTFKTAQVDVARKGRWQGRTVFDGVESEQACRGGKHRFDYDARVSIWTIPPACLGRSPWVRVGFSGLLSNGRHLFEDNAFAKGTASKPLFSAKVWRG